MDEEELNEGQEIIMQEQENEIEDKRYSKGDLLTNRNVYA